ncbi:hypothetical protein AXG93_2253s1110 [Marchantia polymorpha subsp. ruderalis]|uniref:Uncharacterized protein n=1 Tax=Marchantia polymorpha subsp. ruderalis TaxID=1480154 RepID=A0A176VSB7_MARPO|nr:hypothetical protein AXG93_2253s1110 [Marchantia polymorpha subsp. ruderalis]
MAQIGGPLSTTLQFDINEKRISILSVVERRCDYLLTLSLSVHWFELLSEVKDAKHRNSTISILRSGGPLDNPSIAEDANIISPDVRTVLQSYQLKGGNYIKYTIMSSTGPESVAELADNTRQEQDSVRASMSQGEMKPEGQDVQAWNPMKSRGEQ